MNEFHHGGAIATDARGKMREGRGGIPRDANAVVACPNLRVCNVLNRNGLQGDFRVGRCIGTPSQMSRVKDILDPYADGDQRRVLDSVSSDCAMPRSIRAQISPLTVR